MNTQITKKVAIKLRESFFSLTLGEKGITGMKSSGSVKVEGEKKREEARALRLRYIHIYILLIRLVIFTRFFYSSLFTNKYKVFLSARQSQVACALLTNRNSRTVCSLQLEQVARSIRLITKISYNNCWSIQN